MRILSVKSKLYITALSLAACALAAIAISAEEQKEKLKAPSYKFVELLNADSSHFKLGDKKIYILKGNVKMRQGDTVITADSIEYNQDAEVQTAVASGNLKITDPKNEITGNKGTVYFREKRAVIEGTVKIVSQPKSAEASNSSGIKANMKNPTTITCNNLEYLYKTKIAKLNGQLKIMQKDRTVTADSAVYQVKEELVTLNGNVNGKDEKNQTFSAPGEVKVSLKDGNEWVEMKNATGTFRVEIDDEDEPQPASDTKPVADAEKKP
jgi:lipopolysaccharide assembly outer membrane protein LptD (OstA)